MVELTELLCKIRDRPFYDLFRIVETVQKVPLLKKGEFLACFPQYKARVVGEILEAGGADYLLQIAARRNNGAAFSSTDEMREYYRGILDLDRGNNRRKRI